MDDKSRARNPRRAGGKEERDKVFAGVVSLFAAAVERLRSRGRDVDYTETTLTWDDDPDGGLASARVPRRPPDGSGSGSAMLLEPTADEGLTHKLLSRQAPKDET
jgi:hypothetical protein